jgi:raffinose/stachyose/melibiose transport system permease protein
MRSILNRKKYDKYSIYSYSFALPAVIIFSVLFVIPALMGAYYSFTFWDFETARFAGLANFKNIFTDISLRVAIPNTLIFAAITTIFKVGFGVILALLLNKQLKLRNFYRSTFFFPTVLNSVSVGVAFSAILYPTGILNTFLRMIGLKFLAMDWLANIKLAIYSVSFLEIWKWTGVIMVIVLAGLQSISQDYYEAAEIDGANGYQKSIFITIPLAMPSINNGIVLSIVGGLKVFDIVYATTQGGPGTATEVINSLVYHAFGGGRYGEASAANLFLMVIVGIIGISSQRYLVKKEVEHY